MHAGDEPSAETKPKKKKRMAKAKLAVVASLAAAVIDETSAPVIDETSAVVASLAAAASANGTSVDAADASEDRPTTLSVLLPALPTNAKTASTNQGAAVGAPSRPQV